MRRMPTLETDGLRGGVVYHDVTERKWAMKALEAGVDGLICVNGRAGGHAGAKGAQELYDELQDLGVPLVMAGGVGGPRGFVEALGQGYEAVQLGTRIVMLTQRPAEICYDEQIDLPYPRSPAADEIFALEKRLRTVFAERARVA